MSNRQYVSIIYYYLVQVTKYRYISRYLESRYHLVCTMVPISYEFSVFFYCYLLSTNWLDDYINFFYQSYVVVKYEYKNCRKRKNTHTLSSAQSKASRCIMVIRIVELSSGGYKIRKIFAEKSTYPKEIIEFLNPFIF